MDRLELIELLVQKEIDVRFSYPYSRKLSQIQEVVLALKEGKPVEQKAVFLLSELGTECTVSPTPKMDVADLVETKTEAAPTPRYHHNSFATATLPWLFYHDNAYFWKEFLANKNGGNRLQRLWQSVSPLLLQSKPIKKASIRHICVSNCDYFCVLLPISDSSDDTIVVAFTLGAAEGLQRCFVLKQLDSQLYSSRVGDIFQVAEDGSETIVQRECPLNPESFVELLKSYLLQESKASASHKVSRIHDSLVLAPNWLSICRLCFEVIPSIAGNSAEELYAAFKQGKTSSFVSDWMQRNHDVSPECEVVAAVYEHAIYEFHGLIIKLVEPEVAPAPKYICVLFRPVKHGLASVEIECIYTLERSEESVSTPWVMGWLWGGVDVQNSVRYLVKYLSDDSLEAFKQAIDAHVGTDTPYDIDNDEYPEAHLSLYGVAATYDLIQTGKL